MFTILMTVKDLLFILRIFRFDYLSCLEATLTCCYCYSITFLTTGICFNFTDSTWEVLY